VNDMLLFLTVGGAYVLGSLAVCIVVVKLLLDWEDRRHGG